MKFYQFLKEKTFTFVILLLALLTIEIFLMIYDVSIALKIYIPISIIGAYLIGIILEYGTKKTFYNDILQQLKELDQKYLVAEVVKEPSFLEGKIMQQVLEQTDKSMIEHIRIYKELQEEYKEYIELWIHEIKLPIATSKLMIENNKNEVTKSIDEELDKIENYIEQALYYARSSTVEKDYCITKNQLKDMVNAVIKKNKNSLIQKKIKVNIHDIDYIVSTDSKWCHFILNQIIQNSIKYVKEQEGEIEIFAIKEKEKVRLILRDNGIGMSKEDVKKAFDKGFTGSNGRKNEKRATGIGLYLCKKLCKKLGIAIELTSEPNIGTKVELIFPKNSLMQVI